MMLPCATTTTLGGAHQRRTCKPPRPLAPSPQEVKRTRNHVKLAHLGSHGAGAGRHADSPACCWPRAMLALWLTVQVVRLPKY